MSANYAKEGSAWKPQLLFHLGRLGGFFILGGVIGALGSALHLGLTGNLILSIIIGIVMLILGINLLDIIHATKRLQITLPKVFAKHTVNKAATATHALTPLLIGIGTFFLPCGFTQSMQVYTLLPEVL
jgi:sulfite exporter TauE/SafE